MGTPWDAKNLPPTTTNLYSVMVPLMLKPIEINQGLNDNERPPNGV